MTPTSASHTEVLVRKLDSQGQETWRYTGNILDRGKNFVRLEARFNRDDADFHGLLFRKNDRFVEWYYSDRWYNIFEIHDREDDRLKGWYCNVGFPAEIEDGRVSYRDLALDLLVFPDGRQLVLDEDEFESLELAPDVSQKARRALAELQQLFEEQLGEKSTRARS